MDKLKDIITFDEKDNQSVSIVIKKSVFKICIGVFAFIMILAIGLAIYGAVKATESVRLHHQIKLQDNQLKMLDSKTKLLEKKMEEVNALDHELRQMINGSNDGSIPQGGGNPKDLSVQKSSTSTSSENPTSLLNRIYNLDKAARHHLVSFYTLKSVLSAGGSERIGQVKNYLLPMDGSSDSHTPSIWPAKGYMTSPFGTRVDPVTGVNTYHEGVDIANDYGTPIVATADGVVTRASYTGGYGLMVELNNGGGFITRYGHNSATLVHVGEQVKKGQVIALMGSTGKSTGTHVHYEVLVNGSNVDPMLFLPIQ